MRAYVMIKDGIIEVIPVEVDLEGFTHLNIRNKTLDRSLLLKHLQYWDIDGCSTPVFLLPRDEFLRVTQKNRSESH